MAEPTELIVTLALVYLLECLHLVPRRAVAVQTLVTGRFTAVPALRIGLVRGGALLMGMPLPPMGLFFVLDGWPLDLDEHGFAGDDGVHRPWAAAAKAGVVATKVVVDDVPVAALSSEASALAVARALKKIALATPAERARLVETLLEARLDGAAARRRVATFRDAVRPLRAAESVLFVSLFAGLPLIFFTDLSSRWPTIAALAVLSWVGSLLAFRAARRRCFTAADSGPPGGRAIMSAVWPLAAMRGSDLLGRYLLADLDPLAGATLLGREGFLAAARRALAELRYPVEPRAGWLDERRRAALGKLLRDEKVDGDALFAPPAPEDAAVARFCPRCRAQYTSGAARCVSCPELSLLPLSR